LINASTWRCRPILNNNELLDERRSVDRRLDLFGAIFEFETREAVKYGTGLEYLKDRYNFNPKFIETVITISSVDLAVSPSPISAFETKAETIIHNQDEATYIGQTIEKWFVHSSISTNKKSLVFKANHTEYDSEVAIKLTSPIYQSYIGNNQGAKQANFMSKSAHPNLVNVLSAGITNTGASYVVMEYLTGLNIVEHCIKNNLSFCDRIDLFRQVCRCVANLHVKLVVHSDIKPDNIILDAHGTPKLLDFDLSHSTNTEFNLNFDYVDITGHTNKYAAPEQLLNSQASPLTDIYNLGVILSEMLGLELKEASEKTNIELLNDTFFVNSRWIELLAVLDKSTSNQPEDRYLTVNDFLTDLSYLESNEMIVTCYQSRASKWYKAKFSLKRSKKKIIVLTTIIIVIFIAISLVVLERFNKHKAVGLLLKNYDHHSINKEKDFDQQAYLALNQSYMFKDKEFDELMSWGKAYYSKGMPTKAKPFFTRANTLYSESFSMRHIDSSSYLALVYYRTGDVNMAFDIMEAMLPALMINNLNDHTKIKALFVAFEIAARFNKDLFKDYENDEINNVLDTINIERLPESEHASVKATITFHQAVNEYYEIKSGDYVSKTVLIKESRFQEEIKPALLELMAMFKESLMLLSDTYTDHYLTPLIKAWIGHISAQLRDFPTAKKFSDEAVDETISMFGTNHPRTVEVYIKRFGTLRYQNPEGSLEAAFKASEIAREMPVAYMSYPYFSIELLATAYMNVGDYPRALNSTKELIDLYETSNSISSTSLKIQTLVNITSAVIDNFDLLPDEFSDDWIIPTFDKYEKLFAGLTYERDETIEFPYYLERNFSPENGRDYDWFLRVYNEVIDHFTTADPIVLQMRYLRFGRACLTYSECDPNLFVERYRNNSVYSAIDFKNSTEYLVDSTSFASLLMSTGEYEEAFALLESVEHLVKQQTFALSLHTSLWHLSRARYFIHVKNYTSAIAEIELSKPGGYYNFSHNDKFKNKIMAMEKIITDNL
jgi:serine/threonine protein kinase